MPIEHFAAGKIIVELSEAANSLISPLITDTIDNSITTFGIDSIDAILSMLPVKYIRRLHGEIEPFDIDQQLITSLHSTYLIRFSVEVDLDLLLTALNAIEWVVNAEPVFFGDLAAVPNDPQFHQQWGLDMIRAPLAWDREKGSNIVKIAVIDTGCDMNHPDLAGRLGGAIQGWGKDFCEDPIARKGETRTGDFTSPDDDPQDELGHGTVMAGILGAMTDNAIGVAGVTWGCRIYALRVACRTIKRDGSVGVAVNSDELAKAIRWAGEWAHVANISMSINDSKHLRDAIAYALAAKTTVVASMGNLNTNVSFYPAAIQGVIAVGAVDKNGYRWAEPDKGSSTGSHICVAAPGAGVLAPDLYATFGSPQYVVASGTSAAAAFVSGVVALLYSCNINITPRQVKQIIEDTASKTIIPGYQTLDWPNGDFGYGIVDAKAAVDRVLDGPLPPP